MNSKRRRIGFTLVELLVVIAMIGILLAMMAPAVQSMRETSRRISCANQLTALSIGLSEYQLVNGHFPAGSVDQGEEISNAPNGIHHNWISAILPQLDLHVIEAKLDREKSIYDDANRTVRTTSIPLLQCPSAIGMLSESASHYAGIHASTEVPIREDNDGVFILNRTLTIDDIPDGISNTVFVGEKLGLVGEDLGWCSGTRSTLRNTGHRIESLRGVLYDDARQSPTADPSFVGGLVSGHPGGSNLLMGSGTIQFFSVTSDQVLLQQLASRNDGNSKLLGNVDDPVEAFVASSPNSRGDADSGGDN